MSKYEQLALELGAQNVQIISAEALVFDPRVHLKCTACSEYGTWRCPPNFPNYENAVGMLSKYKEILVIHDYDREKLSEIARTVEKDAFLDGNVFAFALCGCYHCTQCHQANKGPCANPDFRRPYCYSLGIDVFSTVKALGLPIQVLRSKEDEQNRYAFVLIR